MNVKQIFVALSLAACASFSSAYAAKLKIVDGFSGPAQSSGVKKEILGYVDLEEHFKGKYGKDRVLLTYRIEYQPGAKSMVKKFVSKPVHIFVESGQLTEHRKGSQSKDLAKGDFSEVTNNTIIWWENKTSKPVVLIVSALKEVKDKSKLPKIKDHH